ncbi:hypothetical protein MJD09_14995 [bacterium]|nr:hypothetical protein [bacterium]
MADTNQANGTTHRKPNGGAAFSAGESKAILELAVADNISASELGDLISALSWLHEALSGTPASIDSISVN